MARLRTALFINAHSRRASRLIDRVTQDFTVKQDRFEVVEVIVIKNLKQLDHHLDVLKAVPRLEAVIVGGGDGTIVSVLNALKGRRLAYGFLPLGTSNTFIKSLGLPLQYPLAKRIILKGTPQKASLGAVNGVLFANIAGIGIPARVTTTTTNKIKKIWGPLAYIINGFKASLTHRAFYCQITNDDINEGFYTHYLLLANGEYHGPLSLGKHVSAFNDQLMLIAFGVSDKRRHSLVSLMSAFFGLHARNKQTKMIPFTRALITTSPRRGIEADGEMIARTPATVEIKKDAIEVFTKAPKVKRAKKEARPKRVAVKRSRRK